MSGAFDLATATPAQLEAWLDGRASGERSAMDVGIVAGYAQGWAAAVETMTDVQQQQLEAYLTGQHAGFTVGIESGVALGRQRANQDAWRDAVRVVRSMSKLESAPVARQRRRERMVDAEQRVTGRLDEIRLRQDPPSQEVA